MQAKKETDKGGAGGNCRSCAGIFQGGGVSFWFGKPALVTCALGNEKGRWAREGRKRKDRPELELVDGGLLLNETSFCSKETERRIRVGGGPAAKKRKKSTKGG